jgi:hypothetical protein
VSAGTEIARTRDGAGAKRAAGVLLIYHRPPLLRLIGDASNVIENIASFGRHSRFPVRVVNCAVGFPPALAEWSFDAILIHYSVFVSGPGRYYLDDGYLDYVAGADDSYKLATFQDEHHWCGRRFRFIDEFGIDCVYTMLEQPQADEVYLGRTRASKTVPNLPGYVGPEVIEAGERFRKREDERSVDVFYRGRPIPTYMGRGAREKLEIGERFLERGAKTDLALDIKVLETERLYGDDWYRRMADSSGVLGTESGVSCFDLEDEVRTDYERLGAELGREPTIEELERSGPLARWDWKIPYRTISPRHFEAAALEVCQILYPGSYSGAMEPMRHYIPLEKDFSNFDEAVERFRDADLRRELTENARRDLIESGEYSYERLVSGFDEVLAEAGLRPDGPVPAAPVERALRRPLLFRARYYFPFLWAWLWDNHRATWWALHVLTRPVAIPARAWRRWRRRRAAAAGTA